MCLFSLDLPLSKLYRQQEYNFMKTDNQTHDPFITLIPSNIPGGYEYDSPVQE